MRRWWEALIILSLVAIAALTFYIASSADAPAEEPMEGLPVVYVLQGVTWKAE